ncbi:DUF397 domain-containing protein [Streptacidiphilus sp. N1-3]|uniref:DUF397 domain-containing protein n=1 Tax=Streptacidiphilus alkalitolerans TaxID=3342712 RepID=A0ABV6XF74_9ACTN
MDTHVADSTTLNVDWQKAAASGAQGDCAELAQLGNMVALRQSTDPHGPALLFDRSVISALLAAVKAGKFDHLATDGN